MLAHGLKAWEHHWEEVRKLFWELPLFLALAISVFGTLAFQWWEDRGGEAHILPSLIHLVHLIELHHLEVVEVHHLKEVGWALAELSHTWWHHWVVKEATLHGLGHLGLEVALALALLLLRLLLGRPLLLVLLEPFLVFLIGSIVALTLVHWCLVIVIRADVTSI